MRNGTQTTEAGRQYAAAHAMHYGTKDPGKALERYETVLNMYPESLEAGYSRSVRNIAKTVDSERELISAQIDLVRANV